MSPMSERLPGQPIGRPIGFKTLQEITGYVSIHDGNVIKVTVTVGKILKSDQKDPAGMPIYNITTALNMIALKREEYDAMMKTDYSE